MKRIDRFTISLCLVVLVAFAPSALAGRKKGASTEPGTYKDWKDEIDLLEIVEVFKLADYSKVAVQDFDTSETPLPEADDNTFEPVKKVLSNVEGPLAKGIEDELDRDTPEVVASDAKGEGVLIVTGNVEAMNPGSKAARYWGGFGAGAAGTRLMIEVKDGASGSVLLRITQERRSGVGALGGDYEDLLNRNLRAIGADVALVLGSF
ncbi:MAG: DUF4410 domain-containing protein [Thermoanaerobaculia bacterium]|nr:DUF4410 domain-containing protein [Thermoanaerobaculia bacterium]